MSIAIQPSRQSRVRAYVEAHPNATVTEAARAMKLLASDVREVVDADPKRRTKSSAR